MIIRNKTDITLNISNGECILPNSDFERDEKIFDTFTINSSFGSSTVITEYSIRTIKNYGKLIVEESDEKDTNGMFIIEIKIDET